MESAGQEGMTLFVMAGGEMELPRQSACSTQGTSTYTSNTSNSTRKFILGCFETTTCTMFTVLNCIKHENSYCIVFDWQTGLLGLLRHLFRSTRRSYNYHATESTRLTLTHRGITMIDQSSPIKPRHSLANETWHHTIDP